MPCPVPPEQRPLREYEQLLESWFFVWPAHTLGGLLRPLATSWLLLLPLTVLVASGSWVMRHHPLQLVLAGMVAAVALPILLLVRQWLGWNYVHRRLGQVWEKPLPWRQQDLLVAQHQVQPVLRRLQQGAALAVILALLGASLCQAL
ncbi:MAG: CGLD27 family protein [Cyanobium sp. LacPavin_0818_WC50_MAG_67_9]|nr:CGLD27 family protein [Cyanobium sp. LacPavin_0818_WC50_MAG_67_9]